MLLQKKLEIRSRIVKSQREEYFQQIRESKLYEFACSQRLQKIDAKEILAKLSYPSLTEEDTMLIYEYVRLGPPFNNKAALQIAQNVLNKHRNNGALLQTLCLLIDNNSFLIESIARQDALLQETLKDNMRNSANLFTAIIFILKIFQFNQNSKFFDWLFPQLENIFQVIGFCGVSIRLFHQCCKYSTLFPNREMLFKVASTNLQGENEYVYTMVSEILLAYFSYHSQGDNFGLVVVWVNTHLQNEYQSESVQNILTDTLSKLLLMDVSKEFIQQIVKYDHYIIKKMIVLAAAGGSYRIRINVIVSLCKIITEISNPFLISFASKYYLSESLTRAFDLPLQNTAKLNLLFSISLLLEADHQFKPQFLRQGGMQGIRQYMQTQVAALWEMIEVIIDQLEREQE